MRFNKTSAIRNFKHNPANKIQWNLRCHLNVSKNLDVSDSEMLYTVDLLEAGTLDAPTDHLPSGRGRGKIFLLNFCKECRYWPDCSLGAVWSGSTLFVQAVLLQCIYYYSMQLHKVERKKLHPLLKYTLIYVEFFCILILIKQLINSLTKGDESSWICKQHRSWWGGSSWATSSKSTLFAL